MDIYLYNTWDGHQYCYRRAVFFKVYKRTQIFLQEARGFILFGVVQDPETLLNIQWGWAEDSPKFRIENIIQNESIKLRTQLPKKEFEKLNTIEVIIIKNAIYARILNGEEPVWNFSWRLISKLVNLVLSKGGKMLKNWIKGFGKSLRMLIQKIIRP